MRNEEKPVFKDYGFQENELPSRGISSLMPMNVGSKGFSKISDKLLNEAKTNNDYTKATKKFWFPIKKLANGQDGDFIPEDLYSEKRDDRVTATNCLMEMMKLLVKRNNSALLDNFVFVSSKSKDDQTKAVQENVFKSASKGHRIK